MKRALGEAFLAANGWKLVTGKPDAKKYVLIAAGQRVLSYPQ